MSELDFLRGAYCPLIVPFREDKIDFETYGKLIERQIVEGSRGLLVMRQAARVCVRDIRMITPILGPPN
jgi:dihydrodipicolinate synthase/N-acetylneuraminate lyase